MYLTLCIPCIQNEYSLSYVLEKLKQSHIGKICSIKEFPSQQKSNQKKIFVRLDLSKCSTQNTNIVNRLYTGQNINVMYEEPLFWKLVPCK
jgi:glycerol-3-phosphate responsive antiterminator